MGMIETTLIGVLQEAPKLYTTDKGYGIATLRVQVDQEKTIRGEVKTFTSWHTVKVFGDNAKHLAEAAKKGDTLLARGEPRRNKWVNKEGVEKVTWEIAAETVQVLFVAGSAPAEVTKDNPFVNPQNQADPEYRPF